MERKALTPLEIQHKICKLRKCQRRFLSLTGLTLLESLIAAILTVVMLAGLVGLFVAGKRHIIHAHLRMTAGELGRVFLEPLQMQVRQDTWSNSCLGGATCLGAIQFINDIRYNATYSISDVSRTDLRRVSVNIVWQE